MSINKIAIEVTSKAFLPESYAYRNFLRKHGFLCDFVEKGDMSVLNYDAVILFHGFHPFWKKYPRFIIGEYHSLSVGKFNRLKDLAKKLINVRPDIHVFLNEAVRESLFFSKKTNYIIRGMGVDGSELISFSNNEKIYDVIYCGSERDGLYAEIERLADLGIKIALVGPTKPIEHINVTSFGRKAPSEVRELLTKCRFGLNYTPDVFPYNIQDSTKVIEYCAYGLGVITNRYQWVNEFEKKRSGRFMTISELNSKQALNLFDFIVPNVLDLHWDSLLSNSGMLEKIRSL